MNLAKEHDNSALNSGDLTVGLLEEADLFRIEGPYQGGFRNGAIN